MFPLLKVNSLSTEINYNMASDVIRKPTWWRRPRSLEQCLTLMTAVIIFIVSTLNAEALPNPNSPSMATECPNETNRKLCLTTGCIKTAATVLDYMNSDVDPCDDFYEFSCGNFLKKSNIPDDKSSVTSFGLIEDTLHEQLRAVIEEPMQPDEPKPFQLIKKLYKACMNKTQIEEDGLKTINALLKNIGGWPVLEGDSWKEANFDWRQSVYTFRKIGLSLDYFINILVGIDLKNSTKRIIHLDQAKLMLDMEFFIKGVSDDVVRAYYDYMVDIAQFFGADKDRATKELKESLDFEINLANISLTQEERRNVTALYNPMTIVELQHENPSIPWIEFINNVLAGDAVITNDEVVIVNVPQYLKDFEALINRTPKRVQANYVMWRVTSASIDHLGEKLINRQLEFNKIVTGITKRQSRWEECIDTATNSLAIAFGALYVRKYFNEQARQNTLEIVQDIRDEFEEMLKEIDWMDDETKKHALDKAKSMTNHIAYPDELLIDNKLTEYYGTLELDSGTYFNSSINVSLFLASLDFKLLRQPYNKSDWITHSKSAVINAYYSELENSIEFPAGILQGVFFDADRPRYMNYGAIGFVIGHEITHGFDDKGHQFDKNGNLVQWWAPEIEKAFLQKAQCIIDQYGNYTVSELNVTLNGINTQGENIADNGGVKVAYRAYNSWVKRHGEEPMLPGLNYTPNQMFWISAGNTWCGKYRPEKLREKVTTDDHPPGNFRVLGPLSNLEQFAKDFNCPIGSKMNPKNKCNVW